jgi:hypothetical protein
MIDAGADPDGRDRERAGDLGNECCASSFLCETVVNSVS